MRVLPLAPPGVLEHGCEGGLTVGMAEDSVAVAGIGSLLLDDRMKVNQPTSATYLYFCLGCLIADTHHCGIPLCCTTTKLGGAAVSQLGRLIISRPHAEIVLAGTLHGYCCAVVLT